LKTVTEFIFHAVSPPQWRQNVAGAGDNLVVAQRNFVTINKISPLSATNCRRRLRCQCGRHYETLSRHTAWRRSRRRKIVADSGDMLSHQCGRAIEI